MPEDEVRRSCARGEAWPRSCSPARPATVHHVRQVVCSERRSTWEPPARLHSVTLHRAFRRASVPCCSHVLRPSPCRFLDGLPLTCSCSALVMRAISIHRPPLITTCWARETVGTASALAFARGGRLQARGRRVARVSLSPPAPWAESSLAGGMCLSCCALGLGASRASLAESLSPCRVA